MQPRTPAPREPQVRLHRNTDVPLSPPIAPGLFLLVGLLLLFGFGTALASLLQQGTHDTQALRAQFAARRKVPNHTLAKRGDIYDRTGLPLAHSLPVWECWVANNTIHDAVRPVLASLLADVTGAPAARLEGLLMSGHWGPVLFQSLAAEQLAALKTWKATGWRKQMRAYAASEAGQVLIATAFNGDQDAWRNALDNAVGNVVIRQAPRREYPFGTLAGQVLGYVTRQPGIGFKPGGGVEYWTQQQLASVLVLPSSESSANQLEAETALQQPQPVQVDKTAQAVQLTLDAEIQAYAEQALALGMERTGSTAAAAVILEADSGDILAMASLPAFDPGLFRSRCEAAFRDPALIPLDEPLPSEQEPGQTEDGVRLLDQWPIAHEVRETWTDDLPPGLWPGTTPYHRTNNVLTWTWEPGSIFKPFAMLAALEHGSISLTDLFPVGPAPFRVDGFPINDHKSPPTLEHWDPNRIMLKSSNKGMAQIALRTGKSALLDTFGRLHFGQRALEGAQGEEPGNYGANRKFWAKSDVATLGFGHGQIQANPLQLAAAMNVIATGSYVRPRLIRAVELPGGGWRELPSAPREASFEPAAIAKLQAMMEAAVMNSEGTGTRAQVPGYRLAGKTGTAKKVSSGEYSNQYVSSFLGYGPAEAPRYTMIIMFDEPVNDRFGGLAAAPVFGEIMGWLLRRDSRERQRSVPPPSAPPVEVQLARAD